MLTFATQLTLTFSGLPQLSHLLTTSATFNYCKCQFLRSSGRIEEEEKKNSLAYEENV